MPMLFGACKRGIIAGELAAAAGAGAYAPTPEKPKKRVQLPEESELAQRELDFDAPGDCSVRSLRVRNTFIDEKACLSPTLDRFYKQRQVHSCPSSPFVDFEEACRQAFGSEGKASPVSIADAITHCSSNWSFQDCSPAAQSAWAYGASPTCSPMRECLGYDEASTSASQPSQLPCPSRPVLSLSDALGAVGSSVTEEAHYATTAGAYCGTPTASMLMATYCGHSPWAAAASYAPLSYASPPVPSLALALATVAPATPSSALAPPEAVPPSGPWATAAAAAADAPPPPSGPAPGSSELPSVGSAGHDEGKCKPCAFFHTAGCGNGVLCKFCHLCDAGEKKRRRKDKLEGQRVLRRSLKQADNSEEDSPAEAC